MLHNNSFTLGENSRAKLLWCAGNVISWQRPAGCLQLFRTCGAIVCHGKERFEFDARCWKRERSTKGKFQQSIRSSVIVLIGTRDRKRQRAKIPLLHREIPNMSESCFLLCGGNFSEIIEINRDDYRCSVVEKSIQFFKIGDNVAVAERT